MIATDALAHVAHNSTAENRRQGFDLRDIEHLFVPLVLNGSLGEILAYLARARAGGFTSNRTLMLHRGHTVSKLNSRPQTLPSSFLQLGHRTSLRLASFMVSRLHRFRPTSPLPTQPPTMSNGARSRLWLLRRKQPTEILKGQPTPRFTIVTAWGRSFSFQP